MTQFFIAANGNDTNLGTSLSAPWKTVARVNSQVQAPGDVYSFNGGNTFSGTTLTANSSGVTFTSYGTGSATISVTNADGFDATNFSNLTVSNLIFTGSGGTSFIGVNIFYTKGGFSNILLNNLTVSGFARNGIWVGNNSGGLSSPLVTGVTVSNCIAFGNCGGFSGPHPTAGIRVDMASSVLIANCIAHDNLGNSSANDTGSGIQSFNTSNVLITECVAYNNGGASPGGPIGIWGGDWTNATIQFCESYNNKTQAGFSDGGGFDLDTGSVNCTIQYCYSHGNQGHGFLCIGSDGTEANSNCTIRFNVSQGDALNSVNDQAGITVSAAGTSSPMSNINVYGNTVFGSTTSSFCSCLEYNSSGSVLTGLIANNIFYSTNNLQLTSNENFGGVKLQFRGNCYFATGTFKIEYPTNTLYASLAAFQSATGQEKIGGQLVGLQANPGLGSPGTGGTLNVNGAITPDLLASLSAYAITSSSAVYQKGLNLNTNFGIASLGGQNDFYGNLLIDSSLSIGADCLGVNAPVPRNGNLIYVFQFPSFAAAEADATVGALGFLEVLVYGNLTQNSVTPNSGFWCQIAQNAEINTVLAVHPNLQLIFNQSQLVNGRSVIFTKIPTANIGIIVNAFSNFIANGLS